MTSFEDDRELASGAILLAELALGLLARETSRDVDDCVRELSLQMESCLEG